MFRMTLYYTYIKELSVFGVSRELTVRFIIFLGNFYSDIRDVCRNFWVFFS